MNILVWKIFRWKKVVCKVITYLRIIRLQFSSGIFSKTIHKQEMNILKTFRKFWLLLLLLIPLATFSQETQKTSKKQKKAEQKKEQRVQDARKAEIKGQQRHKKLQDKNTRKRMKKNKKKGTAYVSRRPGFFQRLTKGLR